ncbi:type II toxin-antitoxin system VapC family toxin [bacterium]|nr:type II toxin-antitoxin system VapC family toxin [bacterium]MBU0899320.1 type II toxin-antitoxin system VapC family toxin [bacterium]MBU1152941.1 type II toxin-antitoxin system VapC family toxin [bacterium]MBU1782868.1 type II toxin-antitoxin system VapC family toxin [bacterium]
MKKETLYLDTSVPSAYYDERNKERQRLTWKFWEKLAKYEVYISEMTEIELKNTKEKERKEQLLSLIAEMEILPITEEVIELVQIYLRNKVIPKAKEEDAYHIAVATLNEIDIIVSWNFDHLVNIKTRRRVNGVNILQGYKPIEIISPLELGGD